MIFFSLVNGINSFTLRLQGTGELQNWRVVPIKFLERVLEHNANGGLERERELGYIVYSVIKKRNRRVTLVLGRLDSIAKIEMHLCF